jgi:peptidoglycan/LPS O-acetylase OafA/YrhL
MQSERAKRFVALDSLRGICAVMVAIYHFSTVSFVASLPFIENGFLFVDFFFVLSGFVIASSYGDRLRNGFSITRFMFLRLGRLYPLHLFVLALYLCIAFFHPSDGYSVRNFWITALLLQAFSDGNLGNWNPPSWSISAELWTYLIFALICQYSGRFLIWLLAAFIIFTPPMLWFTSDRYLDVCFQGALLRCLFGFSLGALAFMLWDSRSVAALSRKVFTIVEFIAACASLLIVSNAGAGPLSFLCPPVFMVTVLIFAQEGGAVSSLLRTRPLEALGALSYSIYMTHMFVQARLLNLIGAALKWSWLPISKEPDGAQTISDNLMFATDATIVLMISIVTGCAYLTSTFIENPFRKMSRSIISPMNNAQALNS